LVLAVVTHRLFFLNMSKVFIHSHSLVSFQPTFEPALNTVWRWSDAPILYLQEPQYNDYIPAAHSRRLGKLMKSGMVCAIEAMRNAALDKPEAIITATGKGSLTDTEKLISSVYLDNERMINPNAFVQSTYNSLNGLLGLHFGINCYSNTYTHRGFSLATAFNDAMLLLEERSVTNVLIGSFDEMTPDNHYVKQRMGQWKHETINTQNLLASQTTGAISGEGVAFFVLSSTAPASNPIILRDVQTVYKPQSVEVIEQQIEALLQKNNLTVADIDVVICGVNGDAQFDYFYSHLKTTFSLLPILAFKHLFGEYDTADGAALWLACQIIHNQTIQPAYLHQNQHQQPNKINTVLIYNHFFGDQHTFYLISQP
jgi:3-oxoacyl-(acyl-carrier-protein) synthase